jgi:hypothetical protein
MEAGIKVRVWTGSQMEYNVMAGFLGSFYVQGIDEKDSASISQFNTKYPEYCPTMLFTQLTDKIGKEIWQGDIIKTPRGDWGVIVYKAPFFEVTVSENESCMYTREWFADVEVIGNIYENPDLLTK